MIAFAHDTSNLILGTLHPVRTRSKVDGLLVLISPTCWMEILFSSSFLLLFCDQEMGNINLIKLMWKLKSPVRQKKIIVCCLRGDALVFRFLLFSSDLDVCVVLLYLSLLSNFYSRKKPLHIEQHA